MNNASVLNTYVGMYSQNGAQGSEFGRTRIQKCRTEKLIKIHQKVCTMYIVRNMRTLYNLYILTRAVGIGGGKGMIAPSTHI